MVEILDKGLIVDLNEIPLPDYGNPISIEIYKMKINNWINDFRFKNEKDLIKHMNNIDPTENTARQYLKGKYGFK